MARLLHKVKERKRRKGHPDTISTECGKKGEVKGAWQYVNCKKCLTKKPRE